MLNKHTIWKQVLEVETSDPTAKVGFEREIERWYKDNLLPELEALFDRSAGPNTLLRTEKIEILVTLPLTHNWKEKLCDNVITEVNRHLQNIAPLQLSTPDGMENAFGINHPVLVDSRTPPAIAYWQERLQSEKKGPVLPSDASSVFLHFLETGTLPWFGKQWSNTDLAIQVQEQAARNPGFIQKLRSLLSVQPKALMRCLHQFGEGLLKELFGQTEAYKKMAAWKFILVSAGAQREELFWKWYLQEGKSDKPVLIDLFTRGIHREMVDGGRFFRATRKNVEGPGARLSCPWDTKKYPSDNGRHRGPLQTRASSETNLTKGPIRKRRNTGGGHIRG
jgi:hypothetical protein